MRERALWGCLGLLMALSLVEECRGQRCVPWTRKPSVCLQFPGFEDIQEVYEPPGWDIAWSVGNMTNTYNSVLVSPIPNQFVKDCYDMSVMFACATWIRGCTYRDGVAFPINPCNSLCQRELAYCKPLTDAAGQTAILGTGSYIPPGESLPIVNCSYREEYLPGQCVQLFPNSSAALGNDSQGCIAGDVCNDVGGGLVRFNATCESPLVPSLQYPNRCVFTCPLPSLTDEEYEAANVAQITVGMIACALISLAFLLQVVHAGMREPPYNSLLVLLLFMFPASIGMILPLLAGSKEEIWCGGEDQRIELVAQSYSYTGGNTFAVDFGLEGLIIKSSPCSFQGFLIFVGLVSSTIMWALISLDLCLKVWKLREALDSFLLLRLPGWFSRAYHWSFVLAQAVTAMGIALVLSFVLLGRERIGYGYSSSFCFVTDEDEGAYIISAFFVPVGISLFLGSAFSLLTVVRIFVITFRVLAYKYNFKDASATQGEEDDQGPEGRGGAKGGTVPLESFRMSRRISKKGLLRALTKTMSYSWMTMLILGSMLFVFGFVFSYFIDKYRKRDEAEDETIEYFTELVVGGAYATGQSEFDSDAVSYPALVMSGVFIASMGGVVSLVLLINPHLWRSFTRMASALRDTKESRRAVLLHWMWSGGTLIGESRITMQSMAEMDEKGKDREGRKSTPEESAAHSDGDEDHSREPGPATLEQRMEKIHQGGMGTDSSCSDSDEGTEAGYLSDQIE